MRKRIAMLAVALNLAVAVFVPLPSAHAQEGTWQCSADPAIVEDFTLTQVEYDALLARLATGPVRYGKYTITLTDNPQTLATELTVTDRKGRSQVVAVTCTLV